jgi:hypothetical protein
MDGSKGPCLVEVLVIKKNVIPRFSWELIPNLSHNDNTLPAKLPDTRNKVILICIYDALLLRA